MIIERNKNFIASTQSCTLSLYHLHNFAFSCLILNYVRCACWPPFSVFFFFLSLVILNHCTYDQSNFVTFVVSKKVKNNSSKIYMCVYNLIISAFVIVF